MSRNISPLAGISPAASAPARPQANAPSSTDFCVTYDQRHYRVRGLADNRSATALKVCLRLESAHKTFTETIDLYRLRCRRSFAEAAADATGADVSVLKRDLDRLLSDLEAARDQGTGREPPNATAARMTAEDEDDSLALLRDPKLCERIASDFIVCGFVGEEQNAMLGYLVALSRKLDAPLAMIVQATSSAGKTALMDAALAFVPEEDRVQFSSITERALWYGQRDSLKHRVLAISEDVGAEKAMLALKLLQSERQLKFATTERRAGGQSGAAEYTVEGPTAIMTTTTKLDLDAELASRCLIVAVDEDRRQTMAVQEAQRQARTSAGAVRQRERERVLRVHQNAQRLLHRLPIINDFAERLTFPSESTGRRRDQQKYLGLIDALALLHQHQRERRLLDCGSGPSEHIVVALDDIEVANRLAHHVFGRCVNDLPPQTQQVLLRVDRFVAEQAVACSMPRGEVRFTRREIMGALDLGDTVAKTHIKRLVDAEYLIAHTTPRQQHTYELVFDGAANDGKPHLDGLLDVSVLRLSRAGARASVGASCLDDQPGDEASVRARSGAGRTPGDDESSSVRSQSTELVATDQDFPDGEAEASAPPPTESATANAAASSFRPKIKPRVKK